ncbi:MAG: LCP family protein [Clostridia bacterium]|nr:LCP family protein [Clostridia bacterium]
MRHGYEAKTKRITGAVALIVVLVLAVIGFFIFSKLEEEAYPEQRGQMSKDFGKLPTMEYQGKTYQMKPNLTSMLFIGYDKTDDAPTVGFRQGGQADFLVLSVLDHRNKTVHQLQIDRDTMTNVAVLGVMGNKVGTRVMQICLSHGFGADDETNSKYTVDAVSNLLQGAPIDLYLAMDIRGINILNDALGGVKVPIEDDFSAYDPTMVQGTTMKLQGQQAELYVRSRYHIGDGTNEQRMRRQQHFMDAAVQLIQERISAEASFADTLLDAIEEVSNTNVTRGRLINEINRAYKYDIRPADTLAGEYKAGDDGFMEFHASEESIISWIINVFYNPVE